MKFLNVVSLFGLIASTPCFSAGILSPSLDPLNIPERSGIRIDGSFNDWDAGTYTVLRLFADEVGRRESLDANLRVAWSDTELFIAVTVVDDRIAEAPGFSIWQGDSFVLNYSGGEKPDQPILFMLTPGIDSEGKQVESRTLVNDYRVDPDYKDIEFKPRFSTQTTATGYQMEIALSLECIGLSHPTVGDLIHLQIEIKDREDDMEKPDLQWNPGVNAARNLLAFNRIRLSEQADNRAQFAAMGRIVDERNAEVLIYGDPSLSGLPVTVRFPGMNSISSTLSLKPGAAFAFGKAVAPYSGKDGVPWIVNVQCDQQLLARLDFSKVLWVDSRQDYAPIPSWASMKAFEADRRDNEYSKSAILAIGSSSIRFWDTIAEDFAPWEVIKRGFGGSAMSDVLGAYRYLIEPYDVNRFLIYEGDTESGRSMPEAFLRYSRTFIERLAVDRPGSTIVFLTPKPSPKRLDLWDTTYKKANNGLKDLVGEYENVHLIDVATPLFNREGTLRNELFKSDGVHLNEAGYVVWKEIIQSQLSSIFGDP